MKKQIKNILMAFGVLGFIASAIVLEGVLTCEDFEWWYIPLGIVCGAYFIGTLVFEFYKVKRGEW